VRVLVTGANGMLARAVVPALARAGHDTVAFSRAELDVTDAARVRAAVASAKPDWVCHLAAFTDVDGCETKLDHALRVNGEGAGNAAAAARGADAAVLSVSTDYVRAVNPCHLIVRTAWLYGRGGRNFVDTIRARALAGTPLAVVDDQRGSPTWTEDLGSVLVELMERGVTGTYHATSAGDCTWHEFACEICGQVGARVEVARRSSADLARPAKRPAYSVLDTGQLRQALGHELPQWRDALARYVAQPVGATGDGR
jgi:dTDP-4-dehydrorhamnose reductase